jgi:hypothetical protein
MIMHLQKFSYISSSFFSKKPVHFAHVWLGGEKIFSSLWPLIKGIKQSQFLKLLPHPCVKSRDESNEVFDYVIKGWLL